MQTARLRNTSKTTTIRHTDDRIKTQAPIIRTVIIGALCRFVGFYT